ncbi:MAG: hypothetical protein JSW68_01525, partial [Burkholderiales bacterium]
MFMGFVRFALIADGLRWREHAMARACRVQSIAGNSRTPEVAGAAQARANSPSRRRASEHRPLHAMPGDLDPTEITLKIVKISAKDGQHPRPDVRKRGPAETSENADVYTVAVDIGGTFTDVVVLDSDTGRAFAGKALTTPDDLQRGVVDGLAEAASGIGIDVASLLGSTERMVHATTQSSNAVFAYQGARTAVLTTRGFADTLLIMRATGRVAGLS